MQKVFNKCKKSLVVLSFVVALFSIHVESAFAGYETYGYMQTSWWGTMSAYSGLWYHSIPPDPYVGEFASMYSYVLDFNKSSYAPGETVSLNLTAYAYLLFTTLPDYSMQMTASASSGAVGLNSSCIGAGFCSAVSSFTAPSTPGTYSVTLSGCAANGAYYQCFPYTATYTVVAPTPAPTVTLSPFTPASINVGQTSTTSVSSTNATACSGTGIWNGNLGGTSIVNAVTPVMNTAGTFTQSITCTGPGGSATSVTRSLTVTAPVPTVNLWFTP